MKRLFVHIPKNGGMTIRRNEELKGRIIVAQPGHHISQQYTDELHSVMAAAGEHHGSEHARWRDYREDLRKNHIAFAVVRNPWARTVSRFTFFQLAAQQGKIDMPAKYTFRKFLEERHVYGGRKFYWHRAIRGWFPQVDYVTDESGQLQCDILRLEHIGEDAKRYLGLQKPIGRRNVSNLKKQDYKTFYGSEEFDIVAKWYRADIEFFGFSFEGAATRHTHASLCHNP